MSIEAIGALDAVDSMPSIPQGKDTVSIDQKINQLEEQLRKVKENQNLSDQEREKRVENLERQIQRLQQQKRQQRENTQGVDGEGEKESAPSAGQRLLNARV